MKHTPKIVVKVADFTVIPAYGWYLCDDGNIWYATTRIQSNEGLPQDFQKAGYRLRWINGYPEKFNQ